jgi:hypothetical protein
MTKPGDVFGLLTVVEAAPTVYNYMKRWNCLCACGKQSVVAQASLRSGNTKSCGCQSGMPTHGDTNSTEYKAWDSMHQRCNNKTRRDYANYGGRGITICARWQKYENFLADMGRKPSPELSLDRVNNDGNYEPGNCRWATRWQQNNNSRHCKFPIAESP